MNVMETSVRNIILAEPISCYNHILLNVSGGISVCGEKEISMDKLYSLVCAEATINNWSPLNKDIIELLMWASLQTPASSIHTKRDHSHFFGQSAITKELFPPKIIYMLTKRTSIPSEDHSINIKAENQWCIDKEDWFIKIHFYGVTKKLSHQEVEEYADHRLYLYLKADKYNPYKSLSSEIIVSESSSSQNEQSDVIELTARQDK